MRLFTTQTVAELTGVPAATLKDWVRAGLIVPHVAGGQGRGNVHQFREAQVVAVALGAVYRREGADDARVRGVVRFIAGTPLESIERAVAEGLTMPVPSTLMGVSTWVPGVFVAPPLDDPNLTPAARVMLQRLDLAPVLADTKRKLAVLDAAVQRPGPTRRAKKAKRSR